MLLCAVRYCPSVCCYALSGSALAYAAMRCPVLPPGVCCYALSSTAPLVYAAMRYPVLAYCMVLSNVQS
eukprot:797787-Rhodomonas_salina.1